MTIIRQIEKIIAYVLLALMTIVVISAVIELAYEIFQSAMNMKKDILLSRKELFGIFGLLLMVLIGLELIACIQMYLEENTIHADMMLLVALTAVTRKIVILDATDTDPISLFGIGFLILVLSLGYYLIHKSKSNDTSVAHTQ
jgi:uncharacterized membrane protein (DUF373 family)